METKTSTYACEHIVNAKKGDSHGELTKIKLDNKIPIVLLSGISIEVYRFMVCQECIAIFKDSGNFSARFGRIDLIENDEEDQEGKTNEVDVSRTGSGI